MQRRALVQALAHRGVHQDEAQLLARNESETILALELLGQLVLLDERLDLEGARLRVRGLLALLVELRRRARPWRPAPASAARFCSETGGGCFLA